MVSMGGIPSMCNGEPVVESSSEFLQGLLREPRSAGVPPQHLLRPNHEITHHVDTCFEVPRTIFCDNTESHGT
ncbi:hypothetical protein MSG28_012840 [Choristoneura fumiferana]|uniref:Uncharacterized protein n=1 Tax=Choristoneura fumiferana TaxID=7141 RepID=A0ACC0JI58_CHOFU|nr:hypothetical protein MSG28_012840 [Choristoneura fumiferana]